MAGKGRYFASYKENPKKLIYHTAKNDDWRITIAFTLDRSDFSIRQNSKNGIIAGISSDQ